MNEPAGANDRPADKLAPREGAVVRALEICNKKGLHARASAKFVQTVEKFDAVVRVTRGAETVGGDSIMPATFTVIVSPVRSVETKSGELRARARSAASASGRRKGMAGNRRRRHGSSSPASRPGRVR